MTSEPLLRGIKPHLLNLIKVTYDKQLLKVQNEINILNKHLNDYEKVHKPFFEYSRSIEHWNADNKQTKELQKIMQGRERDPKAWVQKYENFHKSKVN